MFRNSRVQYPWISQVINLRVTSKYSSTLVIDKILLQGANTPHTMAGLKAQQQQATVRPQ